MCENVIGRCVEICPRSRLREGWDAINRTDSSGVSRGATAKSWHYIQNTCDACISTHPKP